MVADLPISQGFSSDICVIRAAEHYGLPPDLMFAVRAVERGKPNSAVANKDGTHDFNEPGLNTRTLRELGPKGWDVYRLSYDGCYAMYAASYWMRKKLVEAASKPGSLLSKAARYHSATPRFNTAYQRRLAPFLANWGCYLHVYWKYDAQSLFVIQSGVLKSEDLLQCKR